jgi:hypothetical protein
VIELRELNKLVRLGFNSPLERVERFARLGEIKTLERPERFKGSNVVVAPPVAISCCSTKTSVKSSLDMIEYLILNY